MNKCSLWQRITLPCLAVLALAGCSGAGNGTDNDDPFTGTVQLEAWVGTESSQLRLSKPLAGAELHASSDRDCEFDTDNTMSCTNPNIYTLNNTTEAFTDTALTLSHPGYYQLRQGGQRLNTLLSPSRFSPRAAHQAVFFNGEFWLLGGDIPGGNSAEIWSSPDGVQWVLRDAEADFGPLAYHQVVIYQNKLWVIGGWKDDGINAGPQQAVWASADGLNWESKTSLPIALNRHQVVVFENIAATEPGDPENTLWVIGGEESSGSATNNVYLLHNGDWITPQIALGGAGASGEPLPKLIDHQVVAFNADDGEQLWVIGGRNESFQRNNDIWRSSDGLTWNQVELDPEEERFSARYAHQAAVFDDQLWVIGGVDGDNKNDIWSSPDGKVWTEQDPPADFPPRAYHQVVVANDGADESLWLIGGDLRGYFLNDTWSSSDGEHWQHRSAQADFFARRYHQVVSFDDGTGEQLWLIGGNDSLRNLNDLWTSPDGLNWTPVDVNQEAFFTPRSSHGAVVFNDQLWVIGGTDGNNALNDVWSSPNGITWTEHTQPAGSERFSPRLYPQVVVFNAGDGEGDKLWVIGGSNNADVWSSVDGDTWTKHNSNLPAGQTEHQVVVFDNGNGKALWLLGRDGNGAAAIWTSTNGETWTDVTIELLEGTPNLPTNSHQAVVFDQHLWVIGGQDPVSNNVWVSSDGSTWKLAASGNNPFAARQYHQAVVFNNALFVIGGADKNITASPLNDVWKSTDGENWQLGLKTNIQALER
ncbi:Kelch repeat-containing protein [Saccharospirillum mangrovi]|uniref:Kelch repeat-containing protein n=1 Tax=Saccharospirillum mangrovi TaxID=2161747 RepID=UPI000D365F0B|nr:kelch repeat-containing protein [Saccharospirillum mangrovi]